VKSVGLSAFSIRVLDRKSQEIKVLDNFNDSGLDLIDILENYLKDMYQKYIINNRTQKLSMVEDYKLDNRTLFGLLKTGEYGYETELHDIEKRTMSHEREPTEAEILPFYFNVDIPSSADEAIVLLQRFGLQGITSPFRTLIVNRFNKSFPGYEMRLNPLVPEQLVNMFAEEGYIERLRFVRFNLPKDIADAIGHPHAEKDYDVELVIRARTSSEVPIRVRIDQFFAGQRDNQGILELEGFDYDTTKVEMNIDGKKRTIDLSDFGKLRPNFDITKEVETGDDGHPTLLSLHTCAVYWNTYLKKCMGFDV
jgi:hypothetical protein